MNILIADDHPLTLQGTKSFVESLGFRVIDTALNGVSALNLIHLYVPDIAILDINMPGLDGLEIAKKVQESKLQTRIILLTMHREMTIYKMAKEYGVYGYVLKENAYKELDNCLLQVSAGNRYESKFAEEDLIVDHKDDNLDFAKLTLSEKKIIQLIAQQKTSKQIAELLFLSEKTVEGHRTHIIEKLGLPKEKNILLKWALQHAK